MGNVTDRVYFMNVWEVLIFIVLVEASLGLGLGIGVGLGYFLNNSTRPRNCIKCSDGSKQTWTSGTPLGTTTQKAKAQMEKPQISKKKKIKPSNSKPLIGPYSKTTMRWTAG